MKNEDKLLIVDDKPANLEIIANYLKERGYKIYVASNSETAIKRAESIKPDIILLDILMPDVDGIETCRILKENKQTVDIPVIFMTALSDIEHKKAGFFAGGIDYITKPIQHEELLARVRTHLKIRHYSRFLEEEVKSRTDEICRAQEEIYVSKLSQAKAEYKILQSQINPHFLYNTLESIKMMAVINEQSDIADALTQLGDLFRYSISKHEDFVFIKDEIKHVKTYLSLIKIRFQERIEFEFDLDEKLMNKKIIKFILQPIVENAVIHGIAKRKDPGKIHLELKEADGTIVFNIGDNGKGVTETRLSEIIKIINEKGEMPLDSIGMTNVNQRIKMQYGDNFGLSVSSKFGYGFTVQIRVPETIK